MLPNEYAQLGKHILASGGFVTNLTLWNESGYFDNTSDTKPLLHLWSLGIEEQFYILWPLILWLSPKRKFIILLLIFFICITSFGLNLKEVRLEPIAAFYSPLTRFWELLCGSGLAWIFLYKENYTHIGNIASIIGISLLTFGVLFIDKDIGFPGEYALIPVTATILILLGGVDSYINKKILSCKIMVFFGLISFPLYLWHWPLLSFARIIEGEIPETSIRVYCLLISILLAWLTFKFIEKPIQAQSNTGSLSQIVLVIIIIIISYIGYNIFNRDGLNFRFNRLSEGEKIGVSKIIEAWKYRGYLAPQSSYIDPEYKMMRIGSNNGYKVLFVGDSHMEQYWLAVEEILAQLNEPEKPSALFLLARNEFPPEISDVILNDSTIKVIVFSYFWSYKYGSEKINEAVRCCGSGKDGSIGPNGAAMPKFSIIEKEKIDENFIGLVKKIRAHNKSVFFILDNPFGEELDPHKMLSRTWRGGFRLNNLKPLSSEDAILRTEPVRSRIVNIAKVSQALVIDPVPHLCIDKICSPFSNNGNLLYQDYDHISSYSSKNMSLYLMPIFQK